MTCSPHPPPPADGTPRTFQLDWWSEAVLAMAKGIEAEWAFDRMPILADALEEAGCDDEVLLRHCRECEQHNPDCWVLFVLRLPTSNMPSLEELVELKRQIAPGLDRRIGGSESVLRIAERPEIGSDNRGELHDHPTGPRDNDASSPYAAWAVYLMIVLVTIAVLSGIKFWLMRF